MKRLSIVVILVLLGWGASAIAQTPFTDSRQAAGDQYGVTAESAPPTPPTTPAESGVAGAGDTGTGADGGSVAEDRDGGPSGAGERGATDDASRSTPGRSGSARRAAPQAAGRTTLGFIHLNDRDPELDEFLRLLLGAPSISVDLDELDERMLGELTAGTPFAGLGGGDIDDEKLAAYAKALGADLVTGGPLAVRFARALDADGVVRPITALVASRNVDGLSDSQKAIADAMLAGILEGALTKDVPVVGVEKSDTDPSNVAFFKKIKGLSIVDDVETPTGQASLKALVAGATPGHYGTEKGADAAAAPTIDPDTSSAVVSGSGDGGGVSLVLVIGICALALVAGRLVATRLRRTASLS